MFDENDLTVGPLAGEQFALPRREGPVDLGKAQETAMSHVGIGDYGNIRTIEFVQPDGTIARLRTRGGYPVFETDAPTPVTSTARGFVAKVPAGRAVLFNPYTLTVLNSDYKPAGKNYTVQDFATTWGVPAGDTTHWHDVVLADGSVKINAKTYSPFGSFGTLSEAAIPHIINRADDYDQYGNVELNLTQKRYFEVERESVKTWGGAGSVSLLTPQAPITDTIRRAMTVGPCVDFPTDTAWLAEFYSSSVIWDDPGALWLYSTAKVQMLLTSAYLVKTSSTANVDMPVASLINGGSGPGTETTALMLPDTVVGYKGYGQLTWFTPYPPPDTFSQVRVQYPTAERYMAPVSGQLIKNYTRSTYSGVSAQAQDQAGVVTNYTGSNIKTWDIGTRQKKHDDINVALPGGGSGITTTRLLSPGAATTLEWSTSDIPPVVGPPNTFMWGSTFTAYNFNEDKQDGSFTVTADGIAICSMAFSVRRGVGDLSVLNPNLTVYDADIALRTVDAIYGTGDISGDTTLYSYKTPPAQTAGVYAEINAEFERMQNIFLGRVLVGNNNVPHTAPAYFQSITLDGDHSYTASLTWQTIDYILNDVANGVFVTVEGSFSGSQEYLSNGTATLTVTLKVKTRYHTTTQILETLTFSYGALLPEKSLGGGRYAVPSPQIRAIFTPLYREQGSFKGAHYVTAAEELAGAVPFHGFNFRLRLTSYDAVGSVNTLNKGETVYLVPCNLLEMLYATVFSSELGVADDGSRYPVTRPASYNAVMNSLFTNAYRVAVRDGMVGNWTDAFGADFAETSTVSLHRT